MNTENMLALANFIEKGQDALFFELDTWGNCGSCNTYACIAGHEYIRNHGVESFRLAIEQGGVLIPSVKESLGLDDEEANGLFLPWSAGHNAGMVDQDKAASVLRWAAHFGKVDARCWDMARKGLEAPR